MGECILRQRTKLLNTVWQSQQRCLIDEERFHLVYSLNVMFMFPLKVRLINMHRSNEPFATWRLCATAILCFSIGSVVICYCHTHCTLLSCLNLDTVLLVGI